MRQLLFEFAPSAAQVRGEGQLGIVALLAGFVLAGSGVWGLSKWGEFWRGERKRVGAQFAVLGRRWGAVGQAVYPFGWVGTFIVGVMILSGFISQESTGIAHQIADVLANIFVGLTLLFVMILLSVVLFNRPRFLVPPHARDFHGFMGDWILTLFRRKNRR